MRRFMDSSDIKEYINPSKYFVKKKSCCGWKIFGVVAFVLAVAAIVLTVLRFNNYDDDFLYGDDYDDDFDMDEEILYASETDFDEE